MTFPLLYKNSCRIDFYVNWKRMHFYWIVNVQSSPYYKPLKSPFSDMPVRAATHHNEVKLSFNRSHAPLQKDGMCHFFHSAQCLIQNCASKRTLLNSVDGITFLRCLLFTWWPHMTLTSKETRVFPSFELYQKLGSIDWK